MSDNLHSGHRKRIKEKFIKNGLDSFCEHEILELLLFYCYPMKDTNKIAHELINEYQSLANLLEAPVEDIVSKCKVTENVAVLISLILPINQRYQLVKWNKKVILDNSKKAGIFATSLFTGKTNENFYLICLDNNKQLIATPLVSEGTVNETSIYIRRVAELCFKFKAVYIFLSHNHPSGNLKESIEDVETTKLIFDALKPLGIVVLDHIIVSGYSYVSLAEKKLF